VFLLVMFLFEHNVSTCCAVYGLDVAGVTKLIN